MPLGKAMHSQLEANIQRAQQYAIGICRISQSAYHKCYQLIRELTTTVGGYDVEWSIAAARIFNNYVVRKPSAQQNNLYMTAMAAAYIASVTGPHLFAPDIGWYNEDPREIAPTVDTTALSYRVGEVMSVLDGDVLMPCPITIVYQLLLAGLDVDISEVRSLTEAAYSYLPVLNLNAYQFSTALLHIIYESQDLAPHEIVGPRVAQHIILVREAIRYSKTQRSVRSIVPSPVPPPIVRPDITPIPEGVRCISHGTFGDIYVVGKNVVKLQMELGHYSVIREIAALRVLRHPNIIPLVTFEFKTSLLSYIELPRAVSDLRAYIRTHTAMTREMKYNLSRDLLRGMSYMHSQGLLHLDIKLANLLVMEDGRLVLADFGSAYPYLSSQDGTLFRRRADVITINYRPPELLLVQAYKNASYSAEVDAWSVGIVLLELALNRADTVPDVAALKDQDEDTYREHAKTATYKYITGPLSDHVADCSDSLLRYVIKRLLSLDPEVRMLVSEALAYFP